MFVDAVWLHLSVFVMGQLVAWRYARSGRFWLGAGVTILIWAAADWWLVSRYLLAVEASQQVAPLLVLQVVTLATACSYSWACLRRWRGQSGRGLGHRRALSALLRGDQAGAVKAYRSLTWSDAWDVAAWVGLGDAQRRSGDFGKARRSYRRARAVDVMGRHQDILDHRRGLLRSAADGVDSVASEAWSRAPAKMTDKRKSLHSKRSAG